MTPTENDNFCDVIKFFAEKSPGNPGDYSYRSALCQLLMKNASAEAASIWNLDAAGMLCLAYGTNVDAADMNAFSLKAGEGVSGAVVLSGKPINIHHAALDTHHSKRLDNLIGFQTKSMISAPIMHDGVLFGVINILNHATGKPFPRQWEERLSVTGVLYAQALALTGSAPYDKRPENKRPVQRFLNLHTDNTVVVGISPGIQNALSLALKAGRTDIPVLIYGETGTGKELLAKRVHEASLEKKTPFLAMNCAAISETLMESELFGHVKGAFSGAETNRKGKFAAASGGILFLDEIADMSLSCQAKMLRAIQGKKVVPLGSETEIDCNVRIVAATNHNLDELVRQGKFREDLYYRLCGLEITIPPLRQRPEDIELLAIYFLKKSSKARQKQLSDDAIGLLKNFSWPGNVRQLEQAIMAAVTVCDGDTIGPKHFPPWLHKAIKSDSVSSPVPLFSKLDCDMDTRIAEERKRYLEALRDSQFPMTGRWNISAAARMLNIPRKTLAYRIKKINLTP